MKVAVASAIMYYLPFYDTLDVISKAGFKYIELDMYSEGGGWKLAQHLKGIPPAESIKMIAEKGLEIASIHNTMGFIEQDSQSIVDPLLHEYLGEVNGIPEFLVFHPPFKRKDNGYDWWNSYRKKYSSDLMEFADKYSVCVENISYREDEDCPLRLLEELYEFIQANNLFINFDTAHIAEDDIDIMTALELLGGKIKSVHLSDYDKPETHVFIGEGNLDLSKFLQDLMNYDVGVLTLECSLDKTHKMTKEQLISRLKIARDYVYSALGISC